MNIMDNLEKFIQDNRARFESGEPLEGHKERFLEMLEIETKSQIVKKSGGIKVRRRLYISLSSAAAVIIAGVIFFSLRSSDETAVYDTLYAEYMEEVSKYREEIEELSQQIYGERNIYDLTFASVSEDGPVPFLSQLPDELSPNEKARLLKDYYNQRLRGLKQMKLLISQSLKDIEGEAVD